MKQYVLVAGVDYEFTRMDFAIFCHNRMKRLLAKNTAKEDATFQIFDFARGQVERREVTYTGGKQTEKVSTDSPFTRITKANYTRTTKDGATSFKFKDEQSGMMSVTDVYAAVRQIGQDAPGTLQELSFLSHAWHGGPILVNSFDDGVLAVGPRSGAFAGMPLTIQLSDAERDPDDKDPRSKDFLPPNMDPSELAQFQAAFRVDGYCWNWGCSIPQTFHEILTFLEDHRRYRETGLGDEDLFEFDTFRAQHIALLQAGLPVAIPASSPVTLKFKHLKAFVCRVTVSSYSHSLAKHSGVKTYAAVIGTSSDYDQTPFLPLLNVPERFKRHLRFYQNYLGFSFDPEGRRYGEFRPDFACVNPGP